MGNTPEEYLKYAIQKSRDTLSKNGYTDKDSLESWLGNSLYYFYQNNTTTGFSRDSAQVLDDVKREDILNFLVTNYIGKINETEHANIRDDFQNILKGKIESDGIDAVKESLKDYIKSGDVSSFPDASKEEVLKYKPESVLQAMGIVTVKKVLEEDSVSLSIPSTSHSGQTTIPASEFAVLSNGEYSIDKTIELMEGIKRGKLSPDKVTEEDIQEL